SSSDSAETPAMWCVIMNLPTSPLALASPFGCLSVAEFKSKRGFCADHAARMTTLASCTCRCLLASKYSTPGATVPAALVRTRVTVLCARTSALALRAAPRYVTCGLLSAPVGQPTWHQ